MFQASRFDFLRAIRSSSMSSDKSSGCLHVTRLSAGESRVLGNLPIYPRARCLELSDFRGTPLPMVNDAVAIPSCDA